MFKRIVKIWLEKTVSFRFVWSMLIGLVVSLPVNAEIDPLEEILASHYPPGLRWDNIESRHLENDKTPWIYKNSLHQIQLEPEKTSYVYLNHDEDLRILATDSPVQENDLLVEGSQDGHLFSPLKTISDKVGNNRIVFSHHQHNRIIRLVNQSEKTLHLALFTSRKDRIKKLLAYRNVLELPLESVPLTQNPKWQTTRYYALKRQQKTSRLINGPLRIRVNVRLQYDRFQYNRQGIQYFYAIDDQTEHTVHIQTSLDQRSIYTVHYKNVVVSREESFYIDIPAGRHRLSLQASDNSYIRLLALDTPDYLFPALNDTLPDMNAVRHQYAEIMQRRTAMDPLLNKQVFTDSLYNTQWLAQFLAINNELRETSLDAADLLNYSASRYQALKQGRNIEQTFQAQNTQFRKLLPYRVQDGNLKRHKYIIPRLKKRLDYPLVTYVHDKNLAPECATRSAVFLDMPESKANAIQYRLPEHQHKIKLRIIVNNTLNSQREALDNPVLKGRFNIQLGKQSVQTFSLYEGIVKSPNFFDTQIAEACLSRSLLRPPGQLLHPVRQVRELTDVHVYTLTVPAGVRDISLWQPLSKPSGAQKISIALEYQAGRSYEMDERLFIRLLERVKPIMLDDYLIPLLGSQPFSRSAKQSEPENGKSKPVLTAEEEYRLRQHWQPMKRFLQSRKKYFTRHYRPKKTVLEYSSEAQLSHYYQLMSDKQKQSQWVEIIELFAQLHPNPDSSHYVPLYRLFFTALERQGERLLRERLLKSVILDNSNQALTRYAFRQLEQDYQTYELEEKLLQLYVIAAVNNIGGKAQQNKNYRQLAISLIRQGYEHFGLQIGLLLEEDSELTDYLLQAAWNGGQWDYFSYLGEMSNSAEARSIQGLLQAYRTGNNKLLSKWLAQNSESRDYRVMMVRKALRLNKVLASEDDSAILKAWMDYRQWLDSHTGNGAWSYWRWRDADELVSRAPGTLTLYNIDRDLYRTGYRLDNNKHVQLKVVGPIRLKLQFRMLYDSVNEAPKYSILRLKDNGKQWNSALYGSIPAYGRNIIERPDKVAGTQQTLIYDVAPGLHEIELQLEQHSALMTLSARQSAMKLPFIPQTMTPSLLTSLGHPAQYTHRTHKKSNLLSCLSEGCMFLYQGQKQIYLPRIQRFNPVTKFRKNIYSNLSKPDNQRVSSQKDFVRSGLLDNNYFRQQRVHLCRHKKDSVLLPVNLVSLDSGRNIPKKKTALCQYNREEAEKILRLLTALLIYRNDKPEAYRQTDSLAGLLINQYSIYPSVHYFRRFFENKARWERVESVTESAGMRLVTQQGWQPLSENIRIRKALLGNPRVSLVLQDSRISGLTIKTYSDARLKLSIDTRALPFQPVKDIRFRYRLNGKAWQSIRLNNNDEQYHRWVTLPAGQHSLNVQWQNPYVGQYVLVKLERMTPQGKQLLSAEENYSYHIATDNEPLVLTLKGPTRLKVHARYQFSSSMQYWYVPPGWHAIRLRNIPGQKDTLYRVYQRIIDKGVVRPASTPAGGKSSALPFSYWLSELGIQADEQNKAEQKQKLIIIDKYPLGRQEDGTLAFGALWSQARDTEDNLNDTEQSDYYEFNLSHYYFSRQLNTYFDTRFLVRTPDNGKVVYGLEETLFIQPDWLSFAIRYDARFYTQEYQSPQGLERASSIHQRLGVEKLFKISPKWSHLPKLTVFNKHYNNKGFINNSNTDIDYDVWSEYGEIHDEGLVAEDTLYYYPWLDTRLSGGFKLYSDESYNLAEPEHLTLNVGWLQLLDKFIINMDYRWSYYYKQGNRNWNRRSDSNKSTFNTSIFWESWVSPVNRVLSNLKLSFDSRANDLSATVGFMYYFDHGSGFKHFRPHSMSFRDLRERKRYWHVNNELNMSSEPGSE